MEFNKQEFQKSLKTKKIGCRNVHLSNSLKVSCKEFAQQLLKNNEFKFGDIVVDLPSGSQSDTEKIPMSESSKHDLYFAFFLDVKDFFELCKLNLSIAIAIVESIRHIIHQHRLTDELDESNVKTLAQPKIKWPNTILVNDKKLASIQIESVSKFSNNSNQNSNFTACIYVSMNVNTSPQINSIDERLLKSTYIQDQCFDSEIDRVILLADIINRFESIFSKHMDHVLQRYKQYDTFIGNEVIVSGIVNDKIEERRAKAVGLSPYGNLQVVYQGENNVVDLISEEVKLMDGSISQS